MTAVEWPGFDDELRAWLADAPGAPAGAPPEVMREYSRRNNAVALSRTDPALTPGSTVDEQVDGPGGPIRVRVVRPAATTGAVPLIVYFHGGGWVIGDIDTHLGHANRLCVQAGAVVVSVDYRLAPEHPFPAAFDDCLAATDWAAANAERLGADSSLLVVAGDSAGGQLAASVALARRDAGAPLAGQLLLYPVIDVTSCYTDEARNQTYRSRSAHALGPGLMLAGMVYFAGSYIGPGDGGDWRVSPGNADRRAVAPAIVHTAAFDVLGSEGRRYADDLRAAGVTVIARDFPSMHHGYFGLGGVSKAANEAANIAATDLRDLLGLAPISIENPA